MANKLYVGNLDYGVTGDQLRELFAQAGTVTDATVITDRYSGRSKGFGFVEMSNDEEAKKAVEMFSGKDFQGRNIIVNEARPRRTEGFGSGMAPRPRPAPMAPAATPRPQPVSDQPSDSDSKPVSETAAEPKVEPEPKPTSEKKTKPAPKDKPAKN